MSRFVLRLFCITLFLSVLFLLSSNESPPRASTLPDGFVISPTSGLVPLEVHVTGQIHAPLNGVEFWRIHWGNGDVYVWGAWWAQNPHITEVDTTYVYYCPGTYTVVREWESSDPTVPIFIDSTTVITVAEPSPYTIAIQYGSPTPRIRLEYIGLTRPDLVTSATIDWGDGSEIMDVIFTLFSNGTVYSQFYYPSSDGEFAATAKTYATFPCFDASPRTATWSWPLVPVEPTTWGRVKALYR
ncbi:MAG: hypothetical protein IH969_03810 [Candidatus Krumholzibacteriota bacterium]|nr:hypothetical protein [Candidatus Krumholzibacteriota bacterium]